MYKSNRFPQTLPTPNFTNLESELPGKIQHQPPITLHDELQYDIQELVRQSLYHFGVYCDKNYPASPGLQSVAWQVRGLGPGAIDRVDWTMNYGVAIAKWDKDGPGKSCVGKQIVDATLGNSYSVTTLQQDIPSINSKPIEGATVPKEQIKLSNDTNGPLTLGFAVDKNVICVEEVEGNAETNYIVHPTYWVALYRDIKLGMLVDTGEEVRPVKVEYQHGCTIAELECTLEAGKIVLHDPVYVPAA